MIRRINFCFSLLLTKRSVIAIIQINEVIGIKPFPRNIYNSSLIPFPVVSINNTESELEYQIDVNPIQASPTNNHVLFLCLKYREAIVAPRIIEIETNKMLNNPFINSIVDNSMVNFHIL